MKSFPDSVFTESPTALIPRARRSKTPFTSPPFSMEMILSWSSSLTQVRKVFSLLWKMPLPWVNEEDQLRIISMEKGGDVKGVFDRLARGIKAVGDSVKTASGSSLWRRAET